jgi:hypothetical protein
MYTHSRLCQPQNGKTLYVEQPLSQIFTGIVPWVR